ncbi:hypothetical protein ACIRQP_40345 [Streptomyces sp. NPDC102274]|uniref:hypothetical protein n=1 Tax=Streptomyces sp. NPDC102274 TaxID=3366151 RepID=UPI00382F18BD
MQSAESRGGEAKTRFDIWDLRTGERTDCGVAINGVYQDLIPPAVFFLPGDRYVVGVWNGAVEVLDTRACTRSTVIPQLVYDTPALRLSGDRRTLVVLGQGTNDVDTWRWDGDHSFEHAAHTTLPAEVNAVASLISRNSVYRPVLEAVGDHAARGCR